MKPLTLTTIDKLKPGDQFYKEKDASKTTFTVLSLQRTSDGKYYVKKGDLKWPDMVDRKESIIFLKHTKI